MSSTVIVTIGLFATILGIYQYFESKPSGDVTGAWTLNLVIVNTRYKSFENLIIGYQLYLNQSGDLVVGYGEKTYEGNKQLPLSQRVKINVRGHYNDHKLDLLFTLFGHERNTIGEFRLEFVSDDVFQGNFSTTGANSNGPVSLKRADALRLSIR